ncbi:MAG: dihydroorotase [Clostridiales bacterium]|nr:dihydroorotase [Clostridiales bacterium]
MAMATIRLTGATIADPATGVYAPHDLWITDGIIQGLFPVGELIGNGEGREIHLDGCVLAPGLTDLHAHLREPGGEENERILTGLQAAAAGGFTTICTMPNSGVKADNPEVIRYIKEKAAELGLAEVAPIAAVTKGLSGVELSDMASLYEAGAVAFSDDGMPIVSSALMECALYAAKELGLVLIDHCEDPELKRDGLMHEGEVSRELGLKGISAVSEASPIARNILLAQKTGAKLHIAHISTKEGVSLLAYAHRQGIEASAEATPHHLRLTDQVLRGYNTMGKVSPPLRSEDHRQAVAEAVRDGLISCIATDHAPWPASAKSLPFGQAPNGISGLETALAVAWDTLVIQGGMAPIDMLSRFVLGPAEVLGRTPKSITPGQPADLVAIDPRAQKIVDPQCFYSMGKNSPLAGVPLRGWPVLTIYQGRVVMEKGIVTG